MKTVREFLNSTAGKVSGTGLLLASVAALGWMVYGQMRPDSTINLANTPLFIDAETGQAFHQTLAVGTVVPVESPFTGRATGYEAELCYWTRDGKPKSDPTPVLLNETVGRPGPTFCPDCGRLVVHHNPPANASRRPPPTRAEYGTKQQDNLTTHRKDN